MSKLIPIRADRNLSRQRPVIELTRFGKLLCHEKSSNRWFRSSQWKVEDQLAQFQGLYENLGEVSLNDLFDLLGIQETTEGRIFGWNTVIHGTDMLLSVELVDKNYMLMDEPVLVITPNCYPEKDYKDHF